MITHIKLMLAIILVLCSCKNKRTVSSLKINKTDSTKGETYFAKKPPKYYFTYDSSKSNIENFDEGYIDTFSINGYRFQLLSNPDSFGDLELQRMKNTRWEINVKFPFGINGNFIGSDINSDGFNDFFCSLSRGNLVYLLNDSTNEFCKEPIYIGHEWSTIDSAKNLYSNNYAYGNYWRTDLFLLKNLKQTFLYNAAIDLHIDSMKEPGYVRLYKLRNGKIDDSALIGQSKFDNLKEGFDYKEYWKKFAKRNIK